MKYPTTFGLSMLAETSSGVSRAGVCVSSDVSDSFVLDAFSVSYELQSVVAVVSVAQMACPGGSGKGLLTGN